MGKLSYFTYMGKNIRKIWKIKKNHGKNMEIIEKETLP